MPHIHLSVLFLQGTQGTHPDQPHSTIQQPLQLRRIIQQTHKFYKQNYSLAFRRCKLSSTNTLTFPRNNINGTTTRRLKVLQRSSLAKMVYMYNPPLAASSAGNAKSMATTRYNKLKPNIMGSFDSISFQPNTQTIDERSIQIAVSIDRAT